MILCHCHVVSDRDICAAIDDGACTLAQVCRATGAGTTCGGCVFSVKAALCHHEPHPALPNLEVAQCSPLAPASSSC